MTISLDGLLDYDEEDREECTFEVFVHAHNYISKFVGHIAYINGSSESSPMFSVMTGCRSGTDI
jgi:hypothetical protein